MKKILFDVRELERKKFSGIGRFVLAILENKDYFKDFEFILVGNKKTDFDKSLLINFEKHIINDSFPFISEQIAISRLIKKIKPDIYFSPYYKYPIFTKIPVITSVFDVTYLKIEPYKSKLINKFYIKNFIKYFTARTNIIITSSYNTKKDILSFFDINEEKIKVIYLPIKDSFKPQSKEKTDSVKQKFKIDRKYILHVGNNSAHKNIKTLYEAYKLLPENIKKEYLLILVGFKDIKNEYPLAKVLSYVEDDDLKALYSMCSLFVFPSLYEGFGYPPLEAVSCGARVLSSNKSSLPEILGDMVFYFNPDDVDELKERIIKLLKEDIEKKNIDLSRFKLENFLCNVKEVLNSLV
ncbi:MAG: glycosyltransferase family 4 protein [Elusimicrobiota bacterium]